MYERDFRGWVKHFDFMLMDILAVTLAFWLSFGLRKGIRFGLESEASYRSFYLIIVAVHIITVFLFRGYSNIVRRGYFEEFFGIIRHNALLLGCVLAYLVFTRQSTIYSRLFLGYFVISSVLFMTIFRNILKKLVRKKLINSNNCPRLLIITDSRMADNCIKKLSSVAYQPFKISGVILLDDEKNGCLVENNVNRIPIVGNSKTMLEYIRLNIVDQVLIQTNNFTSDINNLVNQLIEMGIIVHVNMEQFEELPNKTIGQLGGLSVITSCFQATSRIQLCLKRTMDIIGSLVGLVITVVAFIFVAPAIYIKSPGPVFFSQVRIGKNGRKFTIYKFRSMYMDAEERKKELMAQNKMQGLMFKMDNDPRIIKGIGHFIRKTSIDELPQFWNVLKGDMSLVGTRPPTIDEFEQYNYHHKIRLSFRPGLTGMWQVSGRSDIIDFEEVVRLDEKYIAEWSIWLDIKLLIKTIQVVLQRRGSE